MRFYQIGLGSESEYAYLASRDRTCYARGKDLLAQVPAPLQTAARWEGVLVEAHPYAFVEAFQHVQISMPDAMQNLTWVLGAVWTDDVHMLAFTATDNWQYHHGWSQPAEASESYTPHHPAECEGVSLIGFDVASVTVQQLLLKHGAPDFVVLDCEGAELPLLGEFMRHAPSCTAYQIEAHSFGDAEQIYEIFEINNYSVISSVGRVNDRTEMQAVKNR